MPDTSLLYQPNLSQVLVPGQSALFTSAGAPMTPPKHQYDFAGLRHWISDKEMDSVPWGQSFRDYIREAPVPLQPRRTSIKRIICRRPGRTKPLTDAQRNRTVINLVDAIAPALHLRWDDDERAILERFYGNVATSDIAMALGRTCASLRYVVEKKGLKMRGRIPHSLLSNYEVVRNAYLELRQQRFSQQGANTQL